MKPLQIAPSKHISLMLRELQSENKEHILANCWSHIKISMWDMLLYPNHMAWLREAVRIQLLYQNTATPALILFLISLTEKCRKQNVSRNGALCSWDKITTAKRYLFCEQNAHKCLWDDGEPCGSSVPGTGPVSAVVKRKPDSSTSALPSLCLVAASHLSLSH